MSYDIYLECKDGGVAILPDGEKAPKGGTYNASGTNAAEFNITYNYAEIISDVMDGKSIRSLYGMTGEESIPILKGAIGKLDGEPGEDYWEPTPGNVKQSLMGLLSMAESCPKAIWRGD